MIRLTTALLTALTLSAAALTGAPAAAQEWEKGWFLSYVDNNNNPTDLRNAHKAVAFVRGPRNFVLELACVGDEDRMVFRVARRGPGGTAQFTGPSFKATFEVRKSGNTVFDLTFKNDFQFREAQGHYQGPVRQRLMNQLAKGDAVLVREEGSSFRATFSLTGSARAIAALPCSASE